MDRNLKNGSECTNENNTQITKENVVELLPKTEIRSKLESLDSKHLQVFKKLVEYFRYEKICIESFNEKELWKIVGKTNQDYSIDFYLENLRLEGFLSYVFVEEDNDDISIDILIENIDKYIEGLDILDDIFQGKESKISSESNPQNTTQSHNENEKSSFSNDTENEKDFYREQSEEIFQELKRYVMNTIISDIDMCLENTTLDEIMEGHTELERFNRLNEENFEIEGFLMDKVMKVIW